MDLVLKNIKAIRKKNKLTNELMSKELKIDTSSYNRIENGEAGLSIERLFKIAKIFGMEVEDILTYHKPGNVIYPPITIKAGQYAEHIDNNCECIRFNFPLINENGITIATVEDDNMYPTFSLGDTVFIKREENIKVIKEGEPYLIDSIDGRVIRRIYKHEHKERTFVLVADNDIYKPYEILPKQIDSIWRVKSKFSKNLSPIRLVNKENV